MASRQLIALFPTMRSCRHVPTVSAIVFETARWLEIAVADTCMAHMLQGMQLIVRVCKSLVHVMA